jgi:serine/threonine protein kinase
LATTVSTSPTQDVLPESPVPTGLLAGRYQVLSLLGRGAMGDVYQARHVHAGRIVALKVVNASSAGNERICERVRAEAQACSAARHPNIVEVFDAGELEDGRPYVAMEFLEGRRLLDLFESDGPLPITRACRIIADVARALGAAHKVGIVHRDLKAENVMLVEKDGGLQVKVLDFGIAAAVYREGGRVTLPGIGIGTPEYMAPEQVYGADPTPRFDIYALGVLMYEALTGTLPFTGDQPSAILQRKATTPAPPIAGRREDLPPALAKLVDECLALEPENRPASVDEIVRVLDSYTTETPTYVDGEPQARRRMPLVAITAALFAVATVILLWPESDDTAALVASTVERSASASEAVPEEAKPEPKLEAPKPEPKAAELEPKPEPAMPTEIPAAPEPTIAIPTAPKTPKKPTPSEAALPKPPVAEPKVDESATEACVRRRAEAVDAREAHAWPSLLKATSKSSCWDSQKERTRMRVKALLELLRFDECIAAAGSSSDPEVVRDAKICAKRAAAVVPK